MLLLRVCAFGAVAITAIWFAIGYGVKSAVDRVVFREAVEKADHWIIDMAGHVPDLDQLAETGIPTPEQESAIRSTLGFEDVFRFKLFTPDGRLSLVADKNTESFGGIAAEADPEPLQVARTREAIVEVFDGTEKPDRPDLYAEAYVPLLNPDGSVRAIAEVYVDQTATVIFFEDLFRRFGLLLMAFCAVIFALPSIAFYLQRIFALRSRRDAEFLARFDPLTGLMNRREFAKQADTYLEQGRLSVVCYLDLDHFKTVNDTYGHAMGDAYLAHIADVLRANCRTEDLVARFGGDEFVIGFHNMSPKDAAHRVQSILQVCAMETSIQDKALNASVSIGLAKVEAGESLDDVLKNADTALYFAKSSGRNNYATYGNEMGEELRQRHALEARLREATKTFDFDIHYQPLVCSIDKRTIGHEALLRLSHTDGTPIPPSVFIPLAEELGLIDDIGRWTIQTATRDIAGSEDTTTLAINLSTVQFESGELVATIKDALQASGLPAWRLELEITESLLLEDSRFIEMQIDALRDMGVKIAMDDFGTGFSSLSYLWKYGFDRLKIDRSFIAALDENPERSREIIESVVMLGSRLNMKVTAEGVETIEQSQLLFDLGCDTLQGYLYGRPSPMHTRARPPEQLKAG